MSGARRLTLLAGVVAIAAIVFLSIDRGAARQSRPRTIRHEEPKASANEPATATSAGPTIQVVVRDDATGSPVSNARCLLAYEDGSRLERTSDAEGRARFLDLLAGSSLLLSASAEGYETAKKELVPERRLHVVELRLRGLATLSGVVTGPLNMPLSRVVVIIQGRPERITYTDENGHYRLESLRQGRIAEISFAKIGFRRVRRRVVLERTATLDVSLEAVEMLQVLLQMPGLRKTKGNFTVQANVRCGEHVLHAGRLMLSGGAYFLNTEYRGGDRVHALIQLPTLDRVAADGNVRRSGDARTATLVFDTIKAGCLRFVDLKGKPLSRRLIGYRAGDFHATLRTDSAGSALFPRAANGAAAAAPSFVFWYSGGVSEPVLLGSEETQEVVLGRGGGDLLVITDDVADLSVRESVTGAFDFNPDTSEPGQVRFHLPAGLYRVEHKGIPLTDFEVQVTRGEVQSLVLGKLAERGALVGSTSTSAVVRLWKVEDDAKVRVAGLQADGPFRFDDLVPGEYLVGVTFATANSPLTRIVNVEPGKEQDAGKFSPDDLRLVEVVLRNADGTPYARRRINVAGLPPSRNATTWDSTDANGIVRVALNDAALASAGLDEGYCMWRLVPNQQRYVLVMPDRGGQVRATLPKQVQITDQALWVKREGRYTWFLKVDILNRHTLRLPACSGRQYVLVDVPGRTAYLSGVVPHGGAEVALSQGKSWCLPARKLPAGARTYQLICESIDGTFLGPVARVERPRVIDGKGLDVPIAEGFGFRIVVRDAHGKRWESRLKGSRWDREIDLSD